MYKIITTLFFATSCFQWSNAALGKQVNDEPDPYEELCPIVGYQGSFCPLDDKGNARNFATIGKSIGHEGQLLLPTGVGLTIDVSNGNLKLPALNYSFEGATATWTDLASNETFLLPLGVSLNPEVTEENIVTARVFKSVSDLTAIWEDGYSQENWLGGEFGNSKGMKDLYDAFFSKQQSTSINQHPQALYRLTLADNWEANINSFAAAALKALPEAYDENIYSRFMDTWGTHVAKDTLVGGMLEQQIVMKNCLWANDNLDFGMTGGLTEEQIQEYLKMDLAKAPTEDAFYLDRRQMTIDHRIGGNPELSDQNEWARSLPKNPALVKIYSQVEWSLVAYKSGIVSDVVATNLLDAIDARMSAKEAERNAEKEEVEKQRSDEINGPRSAIVAEIVGRVGDTPPQFITTPKQMTANAFSECPDDYLNIGNPNIGRIRASEEEKCSTGLVHIYEDAPGYDDWGRQEYPVKYYRVWNGGVRPVMDDWTYWKVTEDSPEMAGADVTTGCSAFTYSMVTNAEDKKVCGNTDHGGTDTTYYMGDMIQDGCILSAICTDCEIMSSAIAEDGKLQCVCSGYTAEERKLL